MQLSLFIQHTLCYTPHAARLRLEDIRCTNGSRFIPRAIAHSEQMDAGIAMRQTLQERLARADLAQPLGAVLREIAAHYQLGHLSSRRIFTQGYDDLNILLTCERGQYVAKFFNKAKSLAVIEDHVRVQMALWRRHAPVPRILAPNGEAIYRISGRTRATLVSVSEYFAGQNFVRRAPARDDILAITRFLASMHTMPLNVRYVYDSWATLNLPQEFARKQEIVSDEPARLVAPLADAVAGIQFGRARKCVIHGDLQRKHVLSTGAGQLCILDFGCMNHSYPIVDLGVFLALFCLEGVKPCHAPAMIADVLAEYRAHALLPARHDALLGTVICATWASYLLTAEYLMCQGDHSQQTRQWRRFALRQLHAYHGWL